MSDKKLQPTVVTSPTYDVLGLWISIFGDKALVHYPQEENVKQAWREFGEILGNTKAMKIKYETAGLTQSSKKLDQEINRRTAELENRTLEIIGYPKVASYVIDNLKAEARKISKYLNQYSLSSYPHLPPQVCVDALQKAKPFFDTFEVWAIEDKQVTQDKESEAVKTERAFKDPVIIGCKTTEIPNSYGSPRKEIERYFVASWGDDIPLEQVLGNPKQIEE